MFLINAHQCPYLRSCFQIRPQILQPVILCLRQPGRHQKLHGNRIPLQVINSFSLTFHTHPSHFFEMPEHLAGIAAARERNRQVVRIDLFYPVCVGLVNTGVSVYLVKIVNAQIIIRGLILDNIMPSENPPDRLLDHDIFQFPYDQHIDLQRLLTERILLMYLQVFPLALESDAERGGKPRMPLQFSLLHLLSLSIIQFISLVQRYLLYNKCQWHHLCL